MPIEIDTVLINLLFPLLASLFAGWMISGSFENRVIQESISYGKKRSTVYLAKMLMYSMVVTVLCLIYWCVTALPAGFRNGLGTAEICGNLTQVPYIIGMVAAGSAAYISLFTICGIIAFFTRKTGTTMGICFVGILFGGNHQCVMDPFYHLFCRFEIAAAKPQASAGISNQRPNQKASCAGNAG